MKMFISKFNAVHENLKKESMTEIYKELYVVQVCQGLRPQMQILGNEVSKVLLEFMENENVHFQLVPAYIHWWNVAERAIRACKNHFLAGLSSFDEGFPMHL